MNKSQNKNRRRKTMQGNMTLQKANNHRTEDLAESEEDESQWLWSE
jgi:hypothetical protein